MRDFDNLPGSWTTMYASSSSGHAQTVALRAGWSAGLSRPVPPDVAGARVLGVPVAASANPSEPSVEPVEGADAPGSILSQDVFKSALIRERKRADRFDDVFALATVSFRNGSDTASEELVQSVAAALSTTTRGADVIGWLEEGSILGVIFANLGSDAKEDAQQVQRRVRQGLVDRLNPSALENVNVNWYVHLGPRAEGAQGLCGTDPLLDDIRSMEKRRTVLDAFKRSIDIVGSLCLLILLAPVLALIAAIVKLTSPGPVLFRQVRVGQLAKPFTMLKFRSMHTKSDSAIHEKFVTDFIKSGGQVSQSAGQKFFKIVNDPRITPIGHILRKTSLDELPQLWNVFRGDMSLVGPRPPLRYELEQYRSWHWRRVLEAKPGVTGLWQVEGRSRTTFDEMVRLDLRYVRTRSIWTDIRILLATPRAVVTGKGAC